MAQNKQILTEIKILKQKKVLEKVDSIESVNDSFYISSVWPKVFWRRKKGHKKRPDPEIPFVEKLHPKTILEVGSAYGRVTRKLLGIENTTVTGLEINPNFYPYIEEYSKDYPDVLKAKFVNGSIFAVTKSLPETVFDVIVIPMNTVPNFPFDSLELFFYNVSQVLRKEGRCIFSVHNKKDNDDKVEQYEDSLNGALLLEKGKPPIAQIAYTFPLKQTEYGSSEITYLIHHLFNDKMCSTKKIISRNVTEFVDSNILEELIQKMGFEIELRDDKSFSKIYIIKKY